MTGTSEATMADLPASGLTRPALAAERALARLDEIAALRPGWFHGAGERIAPVALDAVREIVGRHPELIRHAGIFPTMIGGISIENGPYPLGYRIEAGSNGAMSIEIDGMAAAPADCAGLAGLWAAAAPLEARMGRTLAWYDGPVAIEMETRAGLAIGMAMPEPGSGAPFIGILPQPLTGHAYRDGKICLRAVMLEPGTALFLFDLGDCREDQPFSLAPFHGVLVEDMLPEPGLFCADLESLAGTAPGT
ncbi:hypothetical protein [Defluviimonas salinarum]|uniref:Uncharacterized protein n=1 Tax=Defluviimonas salinarum TaxID=2992147 RepID=A0ABT3J5M2_9RHOB|nr:hypothetical protein [Defluviimonas salinarum]MCW3782951.1 hypothetical protein [Defluviimonas salinarum]